MQLKKRFDYRTPPTPVSISEAIESAVSGADYDHGQIETIQATGKQTAAFLGSLVETLYNKGVLSKSDVIDLLGGTHEELLA